MGYYPRIMAPCKFRLLAVVSLLACLATASPQAHPPQAAAAWAKTLGDCRAVTSSTFEPGLDPAYAW